MTLGRARNAGLVIAGFAVTGLLLWWTLRDVELQDVWASFLGADARWLAAGVVAVLCTVGLRSARWHVLLTASAPQVTLRGSTIATMVGQGANNTLPAHAGEFARAFAIARLDGINGVTALGSLAADRLMDLVTVTAMLVATMVLRPPTTAQSTSATGAAAIAVIAVSGAAIATFALARYGHVVGALVERPAVAVLGRDTGGRVASACRALLGGLSSINDPATLARAIVLSAALWLVNAGALACGLLAFGVGAPLSAAFVLQAVIVAAIVLPAAPGFFGPFEAAASLALGWYGISSQEAATFILPFHLVAYFVPVLGLGALGWTLTGLSVTEMTSRRRPRGV
jgi:glycosyltransferase 2 family protein